MDKYIGKLLGGRYEIVEIVGVGGMAVVYRARDAVLGRFVAVKILKDEYAKDPDIRKRFSIESQAVAKLSHHNIVSVFDVGNDDGVDYIVMELIEGITLKEYLQKKGHLSWQESLFFAQQICRALQHAHSRGIIHQDIKPQNVCILRDGTAKLTDFGIASFATTQETRVVQEAIGSVHYISPEQAKGSKIDYRTDLYSLGVVMYEMLTGKLPFEGETALQVVMQHLNAVPLTPSEVQPDVPPGFDGIVMHAMCANVARRYASADELYRDLERLKNDKNARFYYACTPEEEAIGETQVLGREVQQAVRRTPVSPERDRAVVREEHMTQTAVQEPEGFFDRLAEHPGLAAGIAVAVFAVIALLVAGILIATGNSGEKITVPPLVGENIDEVLANEEYTSQFNIREADLRVESDRPVGEILEQDPETGKKVAKGTNITVTVSAGSATVSDAYKIVDFKGKKLDYVTTVLDEHDVNYTTAEEASDEVTAGLVTRTDPAAGAELAKGATLTIYLSTGAEENTVPDLYGQTQEQAKAALEAVKLVLGEVTQVDSSAAAGTVVGQTPEKNTKLKTGESVAVQVSKGPQTQPTQPEDDPTTPDGEQGGNDDTNTPNTPSATGTASIPIVLTPGEDETHVVISIDGVQRYENTYSAGASNTVTVDLEASVGTHSVTVTTNGQSTTSEYTFS